LILLLTSTTNRFRWVACQLDMLGNSLNRSSLRKALRNLPKTLGDTYERILSNIEDDYRDYALTILRWLAFSARSLYVGEAAEIVAITGDGRPQFDKDQVLEDPFDVLTICSSLVTVIGIRAVGPTPKELAEKGMVYERQVFSLAHYSVKEYLLSETIQRSTMATFSIHEAASQAFIAKCCLGYILQFRDRTGPYMKTLGSFQLAEYAAEFWPYHVRAAGDSADSVYPLVMELLSVRDDAYLNWYQIFDVDMQIVPNKRESRPLPEPLYSASAVGLTNIVRVLLAEGNFDINRKSGFYGTPLQVASINNFAETVGLLLDMGADPNIHDETRPSAVQYASACGSLEVVEQLLQAGADSNLQSETYGTALQAALIYGHTVIVNRLLDIEVDVHLQGGPYGDTLQAASYAGNNELISTLLNTGADVNQMGGKYGTALHAAAFNGHSRAVELLLEAGADVNIKAGEYDYALYAASMNNHGEIVSKLLDAGADVNAVRVPEGRRSTALHVAITDPADMDVIDRLLRAGADINFQTSCGNALHIAAFMDRKDVIDRLLKEGANINAHCSEAGTALQVAMVYRSREVAEHLIKLGADINADGPRGSVRHLAVQYQYGLEAVKG
jgi:ankyrin repeat protein